MEIVYSSLYDKQASEIFTSDEEREAAENEIASRAINYPVIPRGSGLRKARAGIGNKGKSGGARVIIYYWQSEDEIFFISAYAKSNQANLSPEGLKAATKLIDTMKQERLEERKQREKRKKGGTDYEPDSQK